MKKLTVLTSLYRCERYLPEYFSWVAKLQHTEKMEILLLHNAPLKEELDIIEQHLSGLPFVRHIIIDEREPLYKTWNRGICMAQGTYITNWNVDDIIFSDSLWKEVETLDNNPQAGMTYGDYYNMYEYGVKGDVVVNADFRESPSLFFEKHQISCFPMWRKAVHAKVGFFDEQFVIVSDFDFQMRVAHSYPLAKTHCKIGMYLHKVPEKLSSNLRKMLAEENALFLRYGIGKRISFLYVKPARKYNIDHVQYKGEWIAMDDVFPGYRAFLGKRKAAPCYALHRQPRFVLAHIKHEVLGIPRK